MALAAPRAEAPASGAADAVLDAVLRSYAQIVFARSRWVGALLLTATFVVPRLGLIGLAAVGASLGAAHLARFSPDLNRSGLFGYNALLVGLAGGALMESSPRATCLLVLAVIATVLVTAATHSVLSSTLGLPALTIPFLTVTYLMLTAAPGLGVRLLPFPGDAEPLFTVAVPGVLEAYLASLGAIFLQPHVLTGLLVLAALLVYSRIGFALSLAGFAGAYLAVQVLYPGADDVFLWVLVLNVTFVCLALGGVWFVPGGWSYALAALGGTLCALVALGCQPVLSRLGLPLLIFPFNATMVVLLVAMRQRIRDGHPKAVDFVPGTPEENRSYFLTRVARFGAHYGIRLHAPFRGRWICTQGVDGSHTHRGPWRHAADFEVAGADGRVHRGEGTRREEYHGYRLPVLAAADGTVVKVVDGIPDNDIGESNLRERWGNLVLLAHAPGLYSLVAHLAPGSLRVQEGQFVRRGDVVGLCGSSGRSPVPHLHFQLQATAVVGAPTIHLELHDVVAGEREDERLHATLVPVEGQELRNVEPRSEIARRFRFDIDRPLRFRVTDREGERERVEVVVPEVGLYGESMLRSAGGRSTLYLEVGDRLMTVFDVVGPRRSVLHLVRASLARVPFEAGESLRWTDHLPARHALPWTGRLAIELLPSREARDGLRMHYRARLDGPRLVVEGLSERMGRDGSPLVTSEAVLEGERGLVSVTLKAGGLVRRAERMDDDDPADPEAAAAEEER